MASTSAPLSLKEAAASSFISNLGEIARNEVSTFCCGGTLPAVSDGNTLVFYKKQPGDEWSCEPLKLPFPDPKATDGIEGLLKACSTASFGVGGKTVTDLTYRNALKLEPNSFTTNFVLANTSVLDHISKVMTIPSLPIKAELYKLNVYSTGGYFKSHVDTPRSQAMFGSLVICLPSAFTGGELVVCHHGQNVIFDWSVLSGSQIQWAGFYSDVEHEVLPVTSGYRITLTFNLYKDTLLSSLSNELPVYDVKTSPLYQQFLAALRDPDFMGDGGILGFYCQHMYVDIPLDNLDEFAVHLKGGDAVLYHVAKTLGLLIEVKPVVKSLTDTYDKELSKVDDFVLNKFHQFQVQEQDLESMGDYRYRKPDELLKVTLSGKFHDNITWCQQKPTFIQPTGAAGVYGNEAIISIYYQTASLLVTIPDKFSDLRKHFGCNGTTKPNERVLSTLVKKLNLKECFDLWNISGEEHKALVKAMKEFPLSQNPLADDMYVERYLQKKKLTTDAVNGVLKILKEMKENPHHW